jgi:hypothetical protein
MADPAAGAVDEAAALLERGLPREALARLPSLGAAPQLAPADARRRAAVDAVARVRLAEAHGRADAWWALLDLNPSSATAAEVKRAAKRLGAAAHPDRAGDVAGASAAFVALGRSAEVLLAEIARRGFNCEDDSGAGRAGSAEGARFAGGGGGAGFSWWSRWDEAELAAAEAGPGDGADEPAARDLAELRALPTAALSATTAARQAAVTAALDAPGGGVAAARAALLRARGALSARLAAELAAAAGDDDVVTGGFLR